MDQHEIVIKLKDMKSVPEVYIKGAKVGPLVDVSFTWQTQEGTGIGYCGYEVTHANVDEVSRDKVKRERGYPRED